MANKFEATATVLNVMELCVRYHATAEALQAKDYSGKCLFPQDWEVDRVMDAPGYVCITITCEVPFNQLEIERVTTLARQFDKAIDYMRET